MSSSENADYAGPAERSALVQRIIEECLERRSSGDWLSDEQIIASHQDLMPELGQELRKLALVERARRHAVDRDTWPLPDSAAPPSESLPLPQWFAGYEIVREIHRGGQGVVYQAIQSSTRRKVAIKVLHGGPFGDAAARTRLEREVQILGQLHHPNIVRVYDSGSAAGCFYYVMDYISGEALDVYARSNRLGVADTLRLFAKVCDAVNAAHLRGVIHRDLKPSNIRVDANGEPHVLDFGLAKVVLEAAPDEQRPALLSLTGQFIGSLPWASPEQAAGQPEKIDLRTDVYSLGVILYQLLTGQFPYEVVGAMPEVLEHILKAEPVRPRPLRRELDDEVETVVLKCLDKQRERRYQSAGELARDIRHYLAGEPLEAKRDSALYLLRKTMRRYRVPLAVGAGFTVLSVAFGITMAFQYQRAEHQARQAELVAGFLDQTLTSVDPEVAQGRDDTLLREVLKAAAARVTELRADPEVEARVRLTIGRTYVNLSALKEGIPHLRRVLEIRRSVAGARNADTAEALNALAWALKEDGQFEEAQTLYEQALALREALFGREHADVAETLNGLGQLLVAQRAYADAEPLLRETLALRRRLPGIDTPDLATSLANLGSLLRDWRRDPQQLDEAEQLLRAALSLRRQCFPDAHPHVVVSMNKLALLLRQTGQTAEARQLFEEALALRWRLYSPRHSFIAVSLNNLALCLFDEGRYEEAQKHFEEALEIWRENFGVAHPHVGSAVTNIVGCLTKLGRFEEAETLVLDRYTALTQTLGPAHAQTTATLQLIIKLYTAWNRPDEAERYRNLLPGPDQSSPRPP